MNKKIFIAGFFVSILLLVPINSAYSNNDIQIQNNPVIKSNRSNNLYVGGSGPNNYTTIQDAINDASIEDTVFVYSNSSPYNENLEVDKSICIIGEDKITTIIDGCGSGDVIYISAEGVNISGFTIRNGTWVGDSGIYINSKYSTISDNIIFNNHHGIWLEECTYNIITGNLISSNKISGIELSELNKYNTFSNNTITSNKNYGIYMCSIETVNNTIIYNNISYNGDDGIILGGFGNIVDNNIIISNKGQGVRLVKTDNTISSNSFINDGLRGSSSHNTIYNNTVNGKPLVYLEDVSNKVIDYEAGQIILFNCNNIIIENLDLSNTDTGIQIYKTNYCRIRNNNFSDNGLGIILDGGRNNITGNTFSGKGYGISFSEGNINIITGNNIYCKKGGIYGGGISNDNIIIGNNISSSNGSGIVISGHIYFPCNNNIIQSNTIACKHSGISLSSSLYNNVTGNTISNTNYGIFMESWYGPCSNNNIMGNNILNNNYGIFIGPYVNNNIIYHNNFINSSCFDKCNNSWDNGYPSGGNYCDDYDGIDSNDDGIGDTPYPIPGGDNEDRYPLIEPYGMTNLSIYFLGGLFRFTGIIKNICNNTAFNVQWRISFEDGFVLLGKITKGVLPKPLMPDNETTISSSLILGFGRIIITIEVWADNSPKITVTNPGFLFLFFILLR
ncbi:hypothetical protein AYK24_01440 [Thermoplasmatales archaeon SG8-52-4]|nr:MAG: hypothetical protein AYK24_01440 [Thermoplasmatales archaeon SG8-52-4]